MTQHEVVITRETATVPIPLAIGGPYKSQDCVQVCVYQDGKKIYTTASEAKAGYIARIASARPVVARDYLDARYDADPDLTPEIITTEDLMEEDATVIDINQALIAEGLLECQSSE